MPTKVHTIEVDERTALALKERADQRGLSVPDLLAEFVRDDQTTADIDADQLAELDRRWAAIDGGQATERHADVVRWLDTWGTHAYKPWRER